MSAIDDFIGTYNGLSAPIIKGEDVTPSDTVDLTNVSRGLMVAVAGDVRVMLRDGDAITLPALQPGTIYPIRASRVYSTSTTATGIKALS